MLMSFMENLDNPIVLGGVISDDRRKYVRAFVYYNDSSEQSKIKYQK
jgi:hypothetical protein